jgi:hypothetical protein
VIAYSFHPDAALEFEEAALFYESRVAGLGKSFSAEIERTIAFIREFPDAGAMFDGKLRRVRVDRFRIRSSISETRMQWS